MHPAYQSAFKLMDLTANFNEQGPLPKLPPRELQSKLLKGGYIGDYIGDYRRDY